MKVLLNIFGARARTTLILLKNLFIPARVGETEVDGAGKGLPHLPAQAIWKTDLNKARRLGIPYKSEVATVSYCASGSRKSTRLISYPGNSSSITSSWMPLEASSGVSSMPRRGRDTYFFGSPGNLNFNPSPP
jgi:hypothetical protein